MTIILGLKNLNKYKKIAANFGGFQKKRQVRDAFLPLFLKYPLKYLLDSNFLY